MFVFVWERSPRVGEGVLVTVTDEEGAVVVSFSIAVKQR